MQTQWAKTPRPHRTLLEKVLVRVPGLYWVLAALSLCGDSSFPVAAPHHPVVR